MWVENESSRTSHSFLVSGVLIWGREWLEELDGKPNTYCSGNVLEIPIGATPEEEVERRRDVALRCIEAITESDAMPKEERADFVKQKMAEIERYYA